MLDQLFKMSRDNKIKMREYDMKTAQRIKEGMYVVKLIGEAEVAARKCRFYAGNCSIDKAAQFFIQEAQILSAAAKKLQSYYDRMTQE